MSLVMPKVRLLGLEYGLRRLQEVWELIRIGFGLELVGVGGYRPYISFFSSGKYISILIKRYAYGKSNCFISRSELSNCLNKTLRILDFGDKCSQKTPVSHYTRENVVQLSVTS